MSLKETITEGVFGNLKTIIVVGALYLVAADQGYAPPLSALTQTGAILPDWWQLPVVVTASAGGVAWVVGSKIAQLLPDPDGHYVIAQEGGDEQGGEVWELNDAAWRELAVQDGTLFPWTGSPKDAHEVRIYNDDTNTVVANWRGTKVASELLAEPTPEDAMENIRELRDEYERSAREGRYIKRNLGGILRKVDKQRAKDYNAALQDHVAPSLNMGDSYEELVEQSLPEQLVPDHMKDDFGSEPEPGEQHGTEMDFAVLEDGEEIDPLPEYDQAAATDGGTER
jgi:hypothetical protein